MISVQESHMGSLWSMKERYSVARLDLMGSTLGWGMRADGVSIHMALQE